MEKLAILMSRERGCTASDPVQALASALIRASSSNLAQSASARKKKVNILQQNRSTLNSINRSANLTFLGHLGRSVGRTVGRGLVILFGALHKGDLLVASFLLLVGSHRGCFGSGKTLENELKIICVLPPTAIQNCTEAAVLLFPLQVVKKVVLETEKR